MTATPGILHAAAMTAHHHASLHLPVCVRCGRVVRVNADLYDTFERMHWVCFHYEFEHAVGDPDRDPDQACDDPSCPMRARFPESSGH
ncbi:hypothetical protein [Streptomyces sp. WMMB303]|uniref:hypothetical protein n=1 Tax=Streptomyces sp. WMMB303 TaxID=3034154 RepID=UPI0023ED61B4|nr:hypothetical protein [Streptomyces sp. WMMB303]MDF4251410.1 hypothetical protein [Streptomyces sp. WMMB303]